MPAAEGDPLNVIILPAQVAVTPAGKPVAVPMPVAPVVACVLLIAVLIHSVVVATVAAVLFAFTVTVTTLLASPATGHPPPKDNLLYCVVAVNAPDA